MSFLDPVNLALLGLVAVVAAVYLLRMPRRHLVVPDAQVARMALADTSRVNRQKRTLVSLAIQAAILALVALAAAMPMWGGGASRPARSMVVLLDMSASMRSDDSVLFRTTSGESPPSPAGRTRFAKAVGAVRGPARSMTGEDRMMVIGVRRTADVLINFEGDAAAVGRALDALAVSAEPANFPQACRLAAEIARSTASAEVVLVTDGAIRAEDLAALAEFGPSGSSSYGSAAPRATSASRTFACGGTSTHRPTTRRSSRWPARSTSRARST